MTEEQYFTFEEVLEKLGLTEEQLEVLAQNGELPGIMRKREMHFRVNDVEAYVSGDKPAEEVDDVVLLDAEDDLEIVSEPAVLLDEESDKLAFSMNETLVVDERQSIQDPVNLDDLSFGLDDEEEEGATLGVSRDDEDEATGDTSATLVLDEGLVLAAADDSSSGDGEDVGATVEIDSDEIGLGTEEIIFEDDDLDIGSDDSTGTQEMTVQEDAVSLPDDSEGLTIEEDAVTSTQILDDDDSLAVEKDSSHSTARKNARSSRNTRSTRSKGSDDELAMIGSETVSYARASGLWALPVAASFLVALVPLSIFVSIVTVGMTMKDDSFLASQITPFSPIPVPGAVVIPEHIKSLSESLDPASYWGNPSTDENINMDEVERRFPRYSEASSSLSEPTPEVNAVDESAGDDADVAEEAPKEGEAEGAAEGGTEDEVKGEAEGGTEGEVKGEAEGGTEGEVKGGTEGEVKGESAGNTESAKAEGEAIGEKESTEKETN